MPENNFSKLRQLCSSIDTKTVKAPSSSQHKMRSADIRSLIEHELVTTNVLMIDDDHEFVDSLCELLEADGGVKVIDRLDSYEEAHAWYSTSKLALIDAIVVDLMLPTNGDAQKKEKHGLKILDELRTLYMFAGPIIIMTDSTDEFGSEALTRGCTAFLVKAESDAMSRMVKELKLSLTGEVVLVSNSLKHVIIGDDESGLHRNATEGILMDMLGHNPAWSDIKKELGYERLEANTNADLDALGDHKNGPKGGILYGASAGLVRHLLGGAPRSIFITTYDGIIIFANAASEKLFGYSQNYFLGQDFKTIFPQAVCKTTGKFTDREFYTNNAQGTQFPISVASSTIEDGNAYCVHIVTDLTSQKTTEQRLKAIVSKLEESSTHLEQLVRTDPLTGLLNRRGLENMLTREIALARRNLSQLIAVLIDLDNFKGINDKHGHAAGDLVLKSVAGVLKDCLRQSDWLGRIGGDEFMIFLPATTLENGALIAERIRASVAATEIEKNGTILRATTSIGVISLPRDVTNLEQVLEMTKAGLKSSKRSGKNIVSVCREEGTRVQNPRFDSYDLLSRKEDFAAEAQPIFSFVDGIAIAYELFARRPGQELSMPGEFFPVARDRGMSTEVDLNCLQACLDEAEKLPPVPVIHINLLPSTLAEVPAEKIIEMTAKLRASRHLCLEFSEKNLMTDPTYLYPKVRQLKEAGILIGLDDVGFGCSSLETLALFDPDCIKIDRKVTDGIAEDPWKQMTVSKILSIAESLSTVPIAEGIEKGADLMTVHRLGVLHGQGWYWKTFSIEPSEASEAA